MPGANGYPKGERSRQTIIETANRLFYERGYQHTSFTDIVAASGMRRGNITYYFSSKEDLLRAVIEQRLQDIKTLLGDWECRYPNPLDRLKRFAEMIRIEQQDIVRYGCPMGSMNTELGKDEPQLLLAAREMFEVFRHWLAKQFQLLGYKKTAAEQYALHLLVRGQGISLLAHVYNDAALLKREVGILKQWLDSLPQTTT
jgi:AcrR family transcriptional regulator